jgi:hypothetical protein
MNNNGAILWRGRSLLDGAPLVVIATGLAEPSSNTKTGDMVQTWILRADIAPVDAVRSGADASICGNCKHRPFNGGTCYVNVERAPTAIWKAFRRGSYPKTRNIASIGHGRKMRIGSYGDPAAVPASIWRELVSKATGHTGYTHQWLSISGSADELRNLVMASADTPVERDIARGMGWRTFRVRMESEPLGERESVCPASEEAGYKTNCATCLACSGVDGKRGSIAIVAHGSTAKRYIELRLAA